MSQQSAESWSLRRSQGLFFSETREPLKNYWRGEHFAQLEVQYGKTLPPNLRNWDPLATGSRSNCPLMHEMMLELTALVGDKLRARARNIYAGRTFSSADTASAAQRVNAGMISMSHEHSSAVYVYACLFGVIMAAADDSTTRSLPESRIIMLGLHDEFEQLMAAYKQGWMPAVIEKIREYHTAAPRLEESADALARSAELWTLAHELAHHLLRHMSSRADKELGLLVSEEIAKSSAYAEKSSYSQPQWDEIRADILATLIMMGRLEPGKVSRQAPYLVMPGAVVSLLAIGHLRSEWRTVASETHPGCFDRISLLLNWFTERNGNLQPDGGEHVDDVRHMRLYRFAAMLMGMTVWLISPQLALKIADDTRMTTAIKGGDLQIVVAHFAALFGLAADRHGREAGGSGRVSVHAGP